LFTAGGDGDGVFEGGFVGPEAELGERGTACEEVQNAADGGLLVVGQGDTGRGLDLVDVLDARGGGWEGRCVSRV